MLDAGQAVDPVRRAVNVAVGIGAGIDEGAYEEPGDETSEGNESPADVHEARDADRIKAVAGLGPKGWDSQGMLDSFLLMNEIEAMATGVVRPPIWLGRENPRKALETFRTERSLAS